MQRSTVVAVMIPLAILCVAHVWAQDTDSDQVADARPRWEHLAMGVDTQNGVGEQDTGAQIIRLGNDGWELVDVENVVKDGTTTKTVYFFKRKR